MAAIAHLRLTTTRAAWRSPLGLMLTAAVTLWSAATVAVELGLAALPGPARARVLLVVGVPAVMAAILLLRRRTTPTVLGPLTLWAGLLAAGLTGGVVLTAQPLAAIAVPTLLLSAVLANRFPAVAIGGLVTLSGAFGSLAAFTGQTAGPIVDVLLGGLWIGATLSAVMGERRRPALIWPGVIALGLYLALTGFEVLTATSLSGGLRAFRTSAWYATAAFLVAYAPSSQASRERLSRIIVLIAGLVGGYACLRWSIGPAAKEVSLAVRSTGGYLFVDGKLRVFGSFTSGHQLGAWTAVAAPFCLAHALAFPGRWRVVAVASALACAGALYASGVRTAAVAIVLGAVVVIVLSQMSRAFPGLRLGVTTSAVLGIVATITIVVSLGAGLPGGTSRYTSLLQPSQDLAYQERVFKWHTALHEIDRHPFGEGLGAGRGSTGNIYASTSVIGFGVDNAYLVIALEQGFAVMVFFMASLLLVLGGLARRCVLTTDPARAGPAIGACGALVAFATMLYSGGYLTDTSALLAWVVLGVGLAQFSQLERPRPLPT